MKSVKKSVRRMLKFVVPSLTLAILLNLPAFFELEVQEIDGNYHQVQPTEMRQDPKYSSLYIMWARLCFLSILPMLCVSIYIFKIMRVLQVIFIFYKRVKRA